MYEQLMQAITETDSDMVICDTFREKGVTNGKHATYPAKADIFTGPIPFCPVNKVYKRAKWEKHHIRFPEGIIWEDTAALAIFYAHAAKIYYINVPLYYQVMRADSTSRNQNLSRKAVRKSISDYLKNVQLIRQHKSYYTREEWNALRYRFLGHFRDAWKGVLLAYSDKKGERFFVLGTYFRLCAYCARYLPYQWKQVMLAWAHFLLGMGSVFCFPLFRKLFNFFSRRKKRRTHSFTAINPVIIPPAIQTEPEGASFRIIGIWLAMHYPVSLAIYREGVVRHLFFVIEHLLQHYGFLRIELWCMDINAGVFKTLLEQYLPFYLDRISVREVSLRGKHPSFFQKLMAKVKSELSPYLWNIWRSYKTRIYRVPLIRKKILSYKYNYGKPEQQFVVQYISQHAKADIFYFTFSWGLGAQLPQPKILVVHDLHTITHQHLFEKETHPEVTAKDNEMLLHNITAFLKNNTHIITLTNFIREKQLFYLLPEANKNNTSSIYTPIVWRKPESVIDKKALFRKFGLSLNIQYIFYPTQIRAQKNMAAIVRALHHLRIKEKIRLYIFSTGNQRQVPDLHLLIKQLKMRPYYIELGSLTDDELYAFHAHALMGAAPSYTEGNFPLQAMESLAMQTPIALADTEIVRDRCAILDNFSFADMEKYMFQPDDYKELARIILYIMQHGKAHAFKEQQPLLSALSAYNWKDAATAYYECMRRHWLASQ